jgi:hypothetical protein
VTAPAALALRLAVAVAAAAPAGACGSGARDGRPATAGASLDAAAPPVATDGASRDAGTGGAAADGSPSDPGVIVECDLVRQDCPAGRRCEFTCRGGRLAIACAQDTSPTVAPGEPCGRTDAGPRNCAKGAGCFATSDRPAQTCYRYCRAQSDCPSGTCDPARALGVNCGAGLERLPVGVCY